MFASIYSIKSHKYGLITCQKTKTKTIFQYKNQNFEINLCVVVIKSIFKINTITHGKISDEFIYCNFFPKFEWIGNSFVVFLINKAQLMNIFTMDFYVCRTIQKMKPIGWGLTLINIT